MDVKQCSTERGFSDQSLANSLFRPKCQKKEFWRHNFSAKTTALPYFGRTLTSRMHEEDETIELPPRTTDDVVISPQRTAAASPEGAIIKRPSSWMFFEALRHFCHSHSSISCVIRKKQLQFQTFASSCFTVTACLGRPICTAPVVPVGQQGTTAKY